LRFRLGRGDEKEGPARRERQEERAGHREGASPLGFWRRGQARAYREQPLPQRTFSRTLRRIRGMYFPPWVPVLFIIVVVFGILGALFVVRSAAGAPRIGKDHWHATYSVFICGQRQPNFPTWEAGVHTHGDGVIHIHPFVPAEEGAGARLVKWFEYGGGKLTQSEMRMPGDRTEYKNGDECDDGSEATLQVFVNGEKMDNWSRYIPHDGDRVRIVFGPIEGAPVELDDRTVIAESEATRTLELEITGAEADAAFVPDGIELGAGETAKVVIKNTGSLSHSVRSPGADQEYDTSDDFVATSGDSDIILPGEEGFMVVRFDDEGEYEFKDPTVPAAIGKIIITGVAPVASPTPTPADGEQEPVDVELDVTMKDNLFQPNTLEVGVGKKFRINLKNEGEFVHNLRIAGPDKTYDSEDDLTSEPDPPKAGEDGTLVGQISEAGVYTFRCDFHPVEMTGTLTVK
jgi:plastocyanin